MNNRKHHHHPVCTLNHSALITRFSDEVSQNLEKFQQLAKQRKKRNQAIKKYYSQGPTKRRIRNRRKTNEFLEYDSSAQVVEDGASPKHLYSNAIKKYCERNLADARDIVSKYKTFLTHKKPRVHKRKCHLNELRRLSTLARTFYHFWNS